MRSPVVTKPLFNTFFRDITTIRVVIQSRPNQLPVHDLTHNLPITPIAKTDLHVTFCPVTHPAVLLTFAQMEEAL